MVRASLALSGDLLNWLRNWWRDLWTSKAFAVLEAESERLRETNAVLEQELAAARSEIRGLVNSALSHAGVTPLPLAEEVKIVTPRIRRLTFVQRQRAYAEATRPPEKEKPYGA